MKEKSNGKKVLMFLIGIVIFVGLMFGGYEIYKGYQASQYKNDDSYKVTTERDTSYNGFYTLTKLDENGNNTWDGLALYVVNDKIVSCSKYEYWSEDELKEALAEKKNTSFDKVTIDIDAFDIMIENGTHITSNLNTGFDEGTQLKKLRGKNFGLKHVGEFVCIDKVDFERLTNNKSDYQYMKECGIVSGYDETSQEVWLSKLLSNTESEYSQNYTLIQFNDYWEMEENCPWDTGDWLYNLNEIFGANFKDYR